MPDASTYLDRLATGRWAYSPEGETATEPAAWTALALAAAGRCDQAQAAGQWLAEVQQDNGALGVSQSQLQPRWPTSLAMLAWATIDALSGRSRFDAEIAAAAAWSLADRGRPAPQSPQIGHDTTLVGWSWAADTHSWLEPTCMFVLGLRAAGFARHARVQEGVRLIADRLLPDGGANYGNTIVLGQPLVPHLQPTGLAMLALAGESTPDGRLAKSLDYLAASVGPGTAPASLAFSCLGLAAHSRPLAAASAWIAAELQDDPAPPLSEYEQALLALAAQPVDRWLPATTTGVRAPAAREEPR